MAREDQLIARVGRRFPSAGYGLRTGIGDDAAIISRATFSDWAVTTDAFIEDVHFRRTVHPPDSVGYKALSRATSDLAAMGARPRYFLLTLAIPPVCAGKWLDGFLAGMARAAGSFGLILVGGDTTKFRSVMASLTVLGDVDRGRAILRSGARPGDLICVSGRLGEAELGLRLVQRGLRKAKPWKSLLKKHFYPEPRLALGQKLAEFKCASAMIDTSDGLSTDLGHLCKASEVGARIWAEKIPAVSVPAELRRLNLVPLQLALHGGEDYELLFTVPKRNAHVLSRIARRVRVPVTIIGEITRSKGITLSIHGGRGSPLRAGGWDPFEKGR